MILYLHCFGNTHISEKLKLGKKILLGLFLSFIPFVTMAQSLELELIRTEQVPGFFAVRIFPDENLKQIDIEDIFVKNYNDNETEIFSELIPILQELKGTVIEKKDLPNYMIPYNRIVLLGGQKVDHYIHFVPENEENVLSEFDSFAEKNLESPILLEIQASFGGNIMEVYPKKIASMDNDPIFFVGKFKKAIKTKIEITALTSEGEITAITPLDLTVFEENEFTNSLPEIWEEVYESTLPLKEINPIGTKFISIFPWLLGLLGIIVIIFAINIGTRFTPPLKYKKSKKDLGHDLDDIPEGFWHQPKEKVDDALPFKVEKKK